MYSPGLVTCASITDTVYIRLKMWTSDICKSTRDLENLEMTSTWFWCFPKPVIELVSVQMAEVKTERLPILVFCIPGCKSNFNNMNSNNSLSQRHFHTISKLTRNSAFSGETARSFPPLSTRKPTHFQTPAGKSADLPDEVCKSANSSPDFFAFYFLRKNCKRRQFRKWKFVQRSYRGRVLLTNWRIFVCGGLIVQKLGKILWNGTALNGGYLFHTACLWFCMHGLIGSYIPTSNTRSSSRHIYR